MQSDTNSTITGQGTSGLSADPSSAAAYDYLVNTATFTSVSANADLSPYHESANSLSASFSNAAHWIWHDATGNNQPADELIRIEETFELTDVAGMFTLTYGADNYAVIFLNGAYIGGGVTWSGVTSLDVSNLLVQGTNTIEMRAWNAPFGGTDSPAGAIYELIGPAQPISIAIDVKPGNGNETDPINPQGKGNIPVAVYSTPDFDATTLDVSTLRFGSTTEIGAGDGASVAHDGHTEDVDGDGLVDLMLHFPTEAAGFEHGDTEAKLVGYTDDGTGVVGTDEIRTVGGKGRGR